MRFLLFLKFIQVFHGAALDARDGIGLEDLFTGGFIKGFAEIMHKFLRFVDLLRFEEFAETAAHELDIFLN